MGAVGASDVIATISAIETALARCGYKYEAGAGVVAAQRQLQ
jgi:aspartate aminotransferase-like enzyme